MAEHSKEYYEKENIDRKADFSIEEIFQKLKPNTSVSKICNGLGKIKISDRDEECYIQFEDGSLKTYEELTGRNLEKKDNKAIWIGLAVVGAWLLSWLLLYCTFGYGEDAAQFGDMFGATNALFSGLAFVGVIYAIVLQRKELKLQRSELRQTREEFKTQNDTLAKQRFENTFFQMIDLHHKIIDKLQFYPDQGRVVPLKIHVNIRPYNGREVFDISRDVLEKIYAANFISALSIQLEDDGKEIDDWQQIQLGYKKFYYDLNGGNSLSHYFMNLYQIFKLIFLSDHLTKDEKNKYASIIRAQLTESELYILLYNGMFERHGNPKFLYLMGTYKILDNINPELAEKIKADITIYNELITIVQNSFLEEHPKPVIPLSNIEK